MGAEEGRSPSPHQSAVSLQIIELSEAVSDVMGAADYIAAQLSLNASEKFIEAIKSAYRRIADMPGIGTLRSYEQPELKEMRMWRVLKYPRYLIFYVTTGTDLIILRVLHGSQDVDAIFRAPKE